MNKLDFLLGASDPEMAEIVRVLEGANKNWAYAIDETKRRCKHEMAYQAAGYVKVNERAVISPMVSADVLVECGGPRIFAGHVFDHHNEGDAGYGRPPAEYMEASSLGQVLAYLGLEPTQDQKYIAAGDHCLSAAYHGQCPGIEPAELRRWRVDSKAKYQNVHPSFIELKVRAAVKTLEFAPEVDGIRRVKGTVDELPEAAAILGVPVEYQIDQPKRTKVGVIGGWTEAHAESIRRWMAAAQARGLVTMYGDPVRGYAGGYEA